MPAVYGKKKGVARAAPAKAWRDVSHEEIEANNKDKENNARNSTKSETTTNSALTAKSSGSTAEISKTTASKPDKGKNIVRKPDREGGKSAGKDSDDDDDDAPSNTSSTSSSSSSSSSESDSEKTRLAPVQKPIYTRNPAIIKANGARKRNLPYRTAKTEGGRKANSGVGSSEDPDTSTSTDTGRDSDYAISSPNSNSASDDSFVEGKAASAPAPRGRAATGLREQVGRKAATEAASKAGKATTVAGAAAGGGKAGRGGRGGARGGAAKGNKAAPTTTATGRPVGQTKANPAARLKKAIATSSPESTPERALQSLTQRTEQKPTKPTTTNVLESPSAAEAVVDPIPTPDPPAPASTMPTKQRMMNMITSTPGPQAPIGIMPSPDFSPIVPLNDPMRDSSVVLGTLSTSFSLDDDLEEHIQRAPSSSANQFDLPTPPSADPSHRLPPIPLLDESSRSPLHINVRRKSRTLHNNHAPTATTIQEPPTVYKTTVAPRFRDVIPLPQLPSTSKSSRKIIKLEETSAQEDTFATFLTATEEGEEGLRDIGLDEVLEICGQAERGVLEFEEALMWADEDGNMHDLRDGMAKIAEATYSEVFSAPLPTTRKLARGVDRPKLVVKILPFCAYEGADIDPETGERTLVNGCGQLEPSAIWTEVACSRRMASVGSGLFGGFLEARIAKGPYLAELHREWCRWDSDRRRRGLNPSDNWEPDYFHENQHYLLLFLPFGGIDLDSFALPSWTAAHSAFWQVTLALAAAEREASFEHRDLHAGNVLLMEGTTEEQIGWTDPKSGKRYEFSAKQVRATVIDYTLARFESEGRLFYNPLDDEELFKGQGDRQYDVYRSMRKVSCGEWRGYWPRTNVLWLEYLLYKILKEKGVEKKGKKKKVDEEDESYRDRLASLLKGGGIDACTSAFEVIEKFGKAWVGGGLLKIRG